MLCNKCRKWNTTSKIRLIVFLDIGYYIKLVFILHNLAYCISYSIKYRVIIAANVEVVYCTLHCDQYIVNIVYSTLHSTLYNVQFTLYTVQYILCTIYSTLYTVSVHYMQYSVHYIIYTVHLIVYTIYPYYTIYII